MRAELSKLRAGLRRGEIVRLVDVPSGLACDCTCPICGQALVAKKGFTNQHHFAHAASSDCPRSLESELHLAAKTILERRKKMLLPPVEIQFENNQLPIRLWNEKMIRFDSIEIEPRGDKVIPDLRGSIAGTPLMIEIFVSHRVGRNKRKLVSELGISMIEIDLSSVPRNFSLRTLENLVINEISNKKWIYNAKADSIHKEILEAAVRKRKAFHGRAEYVSDCPMKIQTWIEPNSANVDIDCNSCYHLLKSQKDYVVCGGGFDVSILEIAMNIKSASK
ncbi:MAG: competence protein CoiA family protein [Pyrinomonadaceae bacterium]